LVYTNFYFHNGDDFCLTQNKPVMKKNFFYFYILGFGLFLFVAFSHAQPDLKQDQLLKRTLVFTFKKASADSIRAVNNACIELSKISAVKSFEWGIIKTGDSTTPVKHIYVFGYASEKDIEVYEKSPQHDQLIKVAKPVLETVQGFDYWAKH
jgi:Stress responsive A/B Barrel Domain.